MALSASSLSTPSVGVRCAPSPHTHRRGSKGVSVRPLRARGCAAPPNPVRRPREWNPPSRSDTRKARPLQGPRLSLGEFLSYQWDSSKWKNLWKNHPALSVFKRCEVSLLKTLLNPSDLRKRSFLSQSVADRKWPRIIPIRSLLAAWASRRTPRGSRRRPRRRCGWRCARSRRREALPSRRSWRL